MNLTHFSPLNRLSFALCLLGGLPPPNSPPQAPPWQPIGISGGGGMFSPAISPADPNLMMLNCDTSAACNSEGGGCNWRMIGHAQLQSDTACRPAFIRPTPTSSTPPPSVAYTFTPANRHGWESTPVHEVFRGQTVWKGNVEVFTLIGHPKAKKAYAWSHPEGPDDTGERFVTILEIPPVESPMTAVRASIMADSKKRQK